MDTRSKILSADSAIETARRVKSEGRALTVITGHFDVLRTAHVRDLKQVREATPDNVLMVILSPREGALLSERARAELAAGLSMVDYVVTEDVEKLSSLLNNLAADTVIRRNAADEEQTRMLMEHVLVRHNRAAR